MKHSDECDCDKCCEAAFWQGYEEARRENLEEACNWQHSELHN
jgi:hypothetical protein